MFVYVNLKAYDLEDWKVGIDVILHPATSCPVVIFIWVWVFDFDRFDHRVNPFSESWAITCGDFYNLIIFFLTLSLVETSYCLLVCFLWFWYFFFSDHDIFVYG